MLSKKDLRSDEMDILRRPRTPQTVVTANGEVQTNEEAQIYVHDLDFFVTVQLLDGTPAVLSLGELITYLLSYQDCHHLPAAARPLHRVHRISQVIPENRNQGHQPVTNRHDKPAAGNRMQETQDRMDTEDRTQEVPEWLQNFSESLEIPEIHLPAHISQEGSDSEGSTKEKVVDKSNYGNTVFIFTFQKTEIATYA